MESDDRETSEVNKDKVRKRGRQSTIKSEALLKALKKHKDDLFYKEPERATDIVSFQNAIWHVLEKETGVKAQTIHAYVFNDKLIYQGELKKAQFGLAYKHGISNNSTLNSTASCTEESSVNCDNTENVQIQLCLSKKVMETITEIEIRRKRSTKRKFKSGAWQYEISNQIYDNYKSSCGFNFETSYINFKMDYASISGHCDCGGQLTLKICASNESEVKFNGEILQIGSLAKPCGKTYCRRFVREQIGKELQAKGTSAEAYRADKAAEKMKMGDPEPSNLPNPGVIRNCLMEANAKTMTHKDVVEALRCMDGKELENIIHQLNVFPFCCLYWTRNQSLVYRHYTKVEEFPKVGLDSSAELFYKVSDPHGNKGGTPFLYSMNIRHCNKIMPIFQWITDTHRVIDIKPCIERFHAETETPFPREAVADGSKALLNALTHAYTDHRTVSRYAAALFPYAEGKVDPSTLPPLPTCYIRGDGAHKMKIYADLCKNLKIFRVRTLYKAWLGHLIGMTSLRHAKKVLTRLFIVALSEHAGELIDGTPSLCQEALSYLEKIVTEIGNKSH